MCIQLYTIDSTLTTLGNYLAEPLYVLIDIVSLTVGSHSYEFQLPTSLNPQIILFIVFCCALNGKYSALYTNTAPLKQIPLGPLLKKETGNVGTGEPMQMDSAPKKLFAMSWMAAFLECPFHCSIVSLI